MTIIHSDGARHTRLIASVHADTLYTTVRRFYARLHQLLSGRPRDAHVRWHDIQNSSSRSVLTTADHVHYNFEQDLMGVARIRKGLIAFGCFFGSSNLGFQTSETVPTPECSGETWPWRNLAKT